MMIGSGEQEVAVTAHILARHFCAWEWEINPTENEGPFTRVKFVEAQ